MIFILLLGLYLLVGLYVAGGTYSAHREDSPSSLKLLTGCILLGLFWLPVILLLTGVSIWAGEF